MNKKLTGEAIDNLFKGILKLETVEECRNFFLDLCTVSELQSMSQRFEVALMLDKNTIYNDIAAKTGASTATISRVNRSLNYGSDGYKMIIERLKNNE